VLRCIEIPGKPSKRLGENMTKPITTPTDADLIRHCIRTVRDADGDRIIIQAQVVHWPHPHEPELEWVPAAELPTDSTQAEIDNAIIKVLRSRKFFKVCRECGERTLSGNMFDRVTCHSCAEKKYGVVY